MSFEHDFLGELRRNEFLVNLGIIYRIDALTLDVDASVEKIGTVSNDVPAFKIKDHRTVVNEKQGPCTFYMKHSQVTFETLYSHMPPPVIIFICPGYRILRVIAFDYKETVR
jgi:hypothetical protein